MQTYTLESKMEAITSSKHVSPSY